ncbi:hypothetical protein NDU88_005398 [Pleurodeles waltl]|uniref:Uncharacterized protein n=1 Tax=Pleurodeles waltl TaxID=8319 RepID=A0AAV7UJI1_PLEWA|nr:hypothetical protein NDU88_005398 [Pleurodeles waltl]
MLPGGGGPLLGVGSTRIRIPAPIQGFEDRSWRLPDPPRLSFSAVRPPSLSPVPSLSNTGSLLLLPEYVEPTLLRPQIRTINSSDGSDYFELKPHAATKVTKISSV